VSLNGLNREKTIAAVCSTWLKLNPSRWAATKAEAEAAEAPEPDEAE